MPTICSFYGIIILMHLTNKEHNPPHIHALYGEYEATFFISNGKLFEGLMPKKQSILIKKFIVKNRDELLEMWKKGIYKKLLAIE